MHRRLSAAGNACSPLSCGVDLSQPPICAERDAHVCCRVPARTSPDSLSVQRMTQHEIWRKQCLNMIPGRSHHQPCLCARVQSLTMQVGDQPPVTLDLRPLLAAFSATLARVPGLQPSAAQPGQPGQPAAAPAPGCRLAGPSALPCCRNFLSSFLSGPSSDALPVALYPDARSCHCSMSSLVLSFSR